MAFAAAVVSAGAYIIGKVADNKTSVASALNGGYACSQGHDHRTEEERSDCETTTRDKQNQDFELKMKLTELEVSKYHNENVTKQTGCCRRNRGIIICILMLVTLVVLAGIAIAILYGLGILFQKD